MLPFPMEFKPGAPIYEQLVYAVEKAIVSGHLRPGDPFPSVRKLSQELLISPNTAQKAVAHLVDKKLLEIRPGIGATVAAPTGRVDLERKDAVLNEGIEQLLVRAKQLKITRDELIEAVKTHWEQLS